LTKTGDFLKEVFAAESQANRKYTAFANPGPTGRTLPKTARLFHAAERG